MSYWDFIQEAYSKVDIYNGADAFLSGYTKQPVWIGDSLSVHWFLSEMSNGGILQFFDNPTGVLAPEAVIGFRHMELPQLGELLENAMKVLGNIYPREQNVRNEISLKLPTTTFKDIEGQFYKTGGSNLGKIYDVMDAYAAKNAGKK